MWAKIKQKTVGVANKVATAKNALVIGMYTAATLAHAQAAGGNAAQQSATKLTGTLTAFLNLMPIVSKLAGVVVLIGGLWSLYKHYKSQGRDGSIAAGIAGICVGVGLFFMGGLLTFGADSLGIAADSTLPN